MKQELSPCTRSFQLSYCVDSTVARENQPPAGVKMFPHFDPKDLYNHLAGKLTDLVVLAIIGFGTTVIGALVKWVQNHTSGNRGAELTARISALSKTISELPDVPLSGATPGLTPRSALTAQLESAVHELTALQAEARAGSRFKGFSLASTIARVRSGFLLYRPQGWAAWTLHLTFYVYMSCYLISIAAVLDAKGTDAVAPQKMAQTQAAQNSQKPIVKGADEVKIPDVPPAVGTLADLFAFIVIFGLFAIPPTLLRHYAAKIHRNQCEKAKDDLRPAAANPETTSVAAAQGAS